MSWRIERFDKSHHTRAGFECGKPTLNDFLHKYATQYEKRNVGRTYVATRNGETQVVGYYTLATGKLLVEDLPESAAKQLPRHPVPVVKLARLAVDSSIQGQGLGAVLLRDAMRRVLEVSEQVGVHSVVVDAIDEPAAKFYERFGFHTLPEQPLKLLLPLSALADLTDGEK